MLFLFPEDGVDSSGGRLEEEEDDCSGSREEDYVLDAEDLVAEDMKSQVCSAFPEYSYAGGCCLPGVEIPGAEIRPLWSLILVASFARNDPVIFAHFLIAQPLG